VLRQSGSSPTEIARYGRVFQRFRASTRGVAAIEFAFLFPVLLLLLLAGIDGGRAVAISMKVRSTAYVVDAIANQYSAIYDSDMSTILGASATVVAPYASGPVAITLSQIAINSGGAATVSWSDTLNGTAYAAGSSITVPANLTPSSNPKTCASFPCYVLLAEVSYTYTPMFGHFSTGTINLSDKIYVTPRNVVCIKRNNTVPASC
jgi:Flp pilus assembly protein TadG